MTELLFPSLLAMWARLAPRLVESREWLRDVVRPTGDVEIYCRDGAIVSGVLVVADGHVVAALLVRARTSRRRDTRWADDQSSWDHWDGR